jgi:hypothetical protein
MPIPFTQYLRPNGRQIPVEIALDYDTELKARAILDAGFKFEIEMLSTGQVSATIADPVNDEDVSHAKIVPNGPAVPQAVKDMIMDFQLKEPGL